ncbi:MAG: hypothetical protein ABIJ43_02890 [Candidatus Beckwithbacteria bacterium]
MKRLLAKLAIISILVTSTQSFFLISPPELDSANLTSAKDTLSSSRLSYYNALSAGNTVGSTLVQVKTSGMPSDSTANLFTGDSVWIGNSITGTNYTVDDILDTDEFQITSALGSGDTEEDDLVIATRSATHTLTFTTATAIQNGAIRILIPSGANANTDGIPNHDGFDFNGMTASDLTQPTGGGVTSWDTTNAPTATASGGTHCTAGNHCFEARYNGTNTAATALTFVIGGTNKLINPAKSGSTEGSADTYTVTIQHLGSQTNGYPVIDSTTVKIAVVESVRVTATVDPTITFAVTAVGIGTTACGNPVDVASTPTTIPFGTLSLNTFTDLAQTLTISTNADDGYAVTVLENDQLGKDGGTDPLIIDAIGAGAMTDDLQDDWHTNTQNGFAYSLDNDDAASIDFQYSDSSGGSCVTGTFCAKQFPANADPDTAERIFYSGTVADAENAYICYRISIGATQEAGDYENNITYTATATF